MKKTLYITMLPALLIMGIAVLSHGQHILAKTSEDSAQSTFQKAKDQYVKEVEFYKDARGDFLDARKVYADATGDAVSEAREEYLVKSRSFVTKIITALIKRLETIKAWVSHRETLTETEKQAIVLEVDQDIDWLRLRLTETDGATADELREIGRTIRDYWKNHRMRVKHILGRIFAARVHYVLVKADEYRDRVELKIDEMEAAGYDVTDLRASLATFDAQLADAQAAYTEAKTTFESIDNAQDAYELFQEGHQYIRDAAADLREAFATLKSLISDMKSMVSTDTE